MRFQNIIENDLSDGAKNFIFFNRNAGCIYIFWKISIKTAWDAADQPSAKKPSADFTIETVKSADGFFKSMCFNKLYFT